MTQGKFHIDIHGKPSPCKAKQNCPRGGDSEHFSTEEEAQQYVDKINSKDTSPTPARTFSDPNQSTHRMNYHFTEAEKRMNAPPSNELTDSQIESINKTKEIYNDLKGLAKNNAQSKLLLDFSKNIGYALEGDKSKFNTLVGNINKLEKEYNVNYPNIKNVLLKTKSQKKPLPVLPAKKTNEINPTQSITDSPKSGESIEVWDTKNKHLIAKRERKRAENKLYEAKLDLKRVEQKALEDGEITIEELGDVELAKMKVSPLEKNLMKAQLLEEKAKAEREAAFLKELEAKGPEGMIRIENNKDFQLYTLENKVELTFQ